MDMLLHSDHSFLAKISERPVLFASTSADVCSAYILGGHGVKRLDVRFEVAIPHGQRLWGDKESRQDADDGMRSTSVAVILYHERV